MQRQTTQLYSNVYFGNVQVPSRYSCRHTCVSSTTYGRPRGGRTRVKCHMTFIACQRRARMRLFPLRACGIMFSSASTSQCVCNKSVQTSTVLISPYYRYKSNTCSRVIVIHRKTNSNYHTFELTITVNEDYLSGL